VHHAAAAGPAAAQRLLPCAPLPLALDGPCYLVGGFDPIAWFDRAGERALPAKLTDCRRPGHHL
jgi:hypothetical protein